MELVALYYKAYDLTDADCPLVIDATTPSCGSSRFGCWVCTVVDKDKSMAGMIASGESWMQPLMDFRDWLYDARNDEDKRMKWKADRATWIRTFHSRGAKRKFSRGF